MRHVRVKEKRRAFQEGAAGHLLTTLGSQRVGWIPVLDLLPSSSEQPVQLYRLVDLSPSHTHSHSHLDQHLLLAQGIHFLGGTGNLGNFGPLHPSFPKGFPTTFLLRGAAGWAGSSFENKIHKVREKQSQKQ